MSEPITKDSEIQIPQVDYVNLQERERADKRVRAWDDLMRKTWPSDLAERLK